MGLFVYAIVLLAFFGYGLYDLYKSEIKDSKDWAYRLAMQEERAAAWSIVVTLLLAVVLLGYDLYSKGRFHE